MWLEHLLFGASAVAIRFRVRMFVFYYYILTIKFIDIIERRNIEVKKLEKDSL